MGQGAALSSRRAALAARARARPRRWPAARTRDDAVVRRAAGSAPRTSAATAGCATRESAALPAPALQRRAGVLIVGAGIAGLAAARALRRAGIDDVHAARARRRAPAATAAATASAACACPLGAHYLPLPGAARARGGRAARRARRARAASTAAPSTTSATCATARRSGCSSTAHGTTACCRRARRRRARCARSTARFARRSSKRCGASCAFAIPTARARVDARRTPRSTRSPSRRGSTRNGLDAPDAALVPRLLLPRRLRRRRGAGVGLGRAALLREPARLSTRPATTHDERDARADLARRQCLARRAARRAAARAAAHRRASCCASSEGRHAVDVDVWDARDAAASSAGSRAQVVLARAAVRRARAARRAAGGAARRPSRTMRHAPWLVANLQLDAAARRPARRAAVVGQRARTAARRSATSMRCTRACGRIAGPTVLTAYWALGGDTPRAARRQRARLLERAVAGVGAARRSPTWRRRIPTCRARRRAST